MSNSWDGVERRGRSIWACNLDYILWRSDLLTTRWMLAWAALIWAMLLLWPGELFTPSRQTYFFMSKVASEEVWGAAFLAQGIGMGYSLLFNNTNRYMWVLDGILGCVLWTVSTVACFTSHWVVGVPYAPPAAMSADVVLMVASWWHLVRFDIK